MAKILCIDDEEFIVQIILEILKDDMGHDVETCSEGKVGLDMALSGSYDLIITDFQMPIVNGSQFAQKLRNSDSACKNAPILFVSAFSDPAREQTKDLENIHFLDKPIIIPALMSAVEDMLSK